MPNELIVLSPQKCRERRKQLDLTEGKVARRAEVWMETYCRWEKGRQKPSRAHLLSLAKALEYYNPEKEPKPVIVWRADTEWTDGQLTAQETGPAGQDGPACATQARVPIPAEDSRHAVNQAAVTGQPVVYLLDGEVLHRTVHALVRENLDTLLAERETKA